MVGFYTYITKDIYKYLALLYLKWSLAPNAAVTISACFLSTATTSMSMMYSTTRYATRMSDYPGLMKTWEMFPNSWTLIHPHPN